MSTQPSPYAGTSPIASLADTDGMVTLVEGQTFCLSGRTGDVSTEHPHGLFVLDVRVLSFWELRVDGAHLEPLAVEVADPFAATFVARSRPPRGRGDSGLVVVRRRHVGRGMRERITVTNHGLEAANATVELLCDVDFADLFAVKESRVREAARRDHESTPHELRFVQDGELAPKQAVIGLSEPGDVEACRAAWRLTLGPGQSWEVCIEVTVTLAGTAIVPRFTCAGDDLAAEPARRLERWRATLPSVETDDAALTESLARCGEDLGALRIFDPDHPELPILAAGAPWFMTVFGRDSLLTAWMTLIADPSLAHGVLETLARFQGDDVVPATEEEPGKILHEMRFGEATGLSLGGGQVYYGSVDATPLFVMLLGELRRWEPRDELVERLLPHADRALRWIDEFGDRDGDGYVEYERQTEHGLANQGWKDSWDAIRFANGALATGPISLCEVQGYVYAAYVARAHFAHEAGDAATQERYAAKARELRRRFNEDFWLEERECFALGLDGNKRPIDAVASNVGHCLWTGIIEPERAALVAARLVSDELFSGWGVRTLSRSMPAYNPVSYHNGSVWPHDNALCAAGLARYGFVEEAHRIIEAQVDVAAAHRGRLPELFAGFDRGFLSVPAAYPTSCSPQAWAAAAPLLWLRTLLRLDPHATSGEVWLHPELPGSLGRLRVEGIRIADQHLTVTVDRDRTEVTGAGPLAVRHQARSPLANLAGSGHA